MRCVIDPAYLAEMAGGGTVTTRDGEIVQYPGTPPTESEQLDFAAARNQAQSDARESRRARARSVKAELRGRFPTWTEEDFQSLAALMLAGGNPEEVQ